MSDPDPKDYAWWREAVAAAARGERVTIQERTPHCGYFVYKLRTGLTAKNSNRYPVVVWREADGHLYARFGYEFAPLTPEPAGDRWTEYGHQPVTFGVYRDAFRAGRFADDLPETPAIPAEPPAFTSDGEPRPNADVADPAQVLRDRIDANVRTAKTLTVTDDDTLISVKGQRALLLELAGDADKAHEAEKAPHLALCKEIDAKWLPLVKDARAAANKLRDQMSNFVDARDRKARLEAAARAAQERAAEAARTEAQEPASETKAPPLAPVEQPPLPPPTTRVRGGYGRAASVKVVKAATVTSYTDFVGAMLSGRFGVDVTTDFKRLLDGMADQLARAGVTEIPGATVDDRKVVQ